MLDTILVVLDCCEMLVIYLLQLYTCVRHLPVKVSLSLIEEEVKSEGNFICLTTTYNISIYPCFFLSTMSTWKSCRENEKSIRSMLYEQRKRAEKRAYIDAANVNL